MTRLLAPAIAAAFALPAALTASPVLAQESMTGMEMPTKPPVTPVPSEPAEPASDPHAGHAMPDAPSAPEEPAEPASDPHAGHTMPDAPNAPEEPADMPGMDMTGSEPGGHDMSAMQPEATDVGSAPAPAPPADHAADALFDPAEMARSRSNLRRENGAFSGSMILFDLAEFQARPGGNGYRWESDAWFGGDIDRLQIKIEGEGAFGEPIEDFEVQALYSRAISPFWNAHIGLRHDIVPNPSRTYAVVGVEGMAPYWIHATGQLFLSDKGDVRVRLEGSYDARITQRLIFQPRFELNLSAQDMPAIGVGSGLSSFEAGARLRYEFSREFAPYIGVEWSGKTGDTARYARLAGDKPNAVNVVAGIRFWF